MENTITQQMGQLNEILTKYTMDHTSCTTRQPSVITMTSKTSHSTGFRCFSQKLSKDSETPKHKTLNNTLILV